MPKTVAVVKTDGFRETLRWDDVNDVFLLERLFIAMGQSSSGSLTEEEARRQLARWGEADRLEDDFEVLEVNEYLTDIIMEGEEWHPLKPTRSTSDE